MGKNTPEYNREYYERHRRKILEERSIRYRTDISFKESVRRYNREAHIPVNLRYPYEVSKGVVLLNEDTVETVKGIFHSTRSLAGKLGCSQEYMRYILRRNKLNKKAIKVYNVNFYPDDTIDSLIDCFRELGFKVRLR
ncbi:MAG: hypothetical protein EOM67_08225 [Spirochaetia bacterium]|nr:hypothetical protein [Spirochaetia bacterium]